MTPIAYRGLSSIFLPFFSAKAPDQKNILTKINSVSPEVDGSSASIDVPGTGKTVGFGTGVMVAAPRDAKWLRAASDPARGDVSGRPRPGSKN